MSKPLHNPRPLPAAFPLPLRLERTGPGLAVLRAPFVFVSEVLGPITVEAGFDTDYASVPRIFWSIYPPDGSYTEAAIIHDALYFYQEVWGRPITRAQADAVFAEAMQALGVPAARRSILYRAVRLGGGRAWRRNAKWRAEAARGAASAERPTSNAEHPTSNAQETEK